MKIEGICHYCGKRFMARLASDIPTSSEFYDYAVTHFNTGINNAIRHHQKKVSCLGDVV